MNAPRSAPTPLAENKTESAPTELMGQPVARVPRSRVQRKLKSEVVFFLLSGGVAALVNLATGAGVRALFGVRAHALAVVVGFIVGTLVSFVLNRELTFRARRDRVAVQASKFVLLAIFGITLAAGVAELALRVGLELFGTKISPRLLADAAHLVSIGTATICNFIGMKYFALRQ